MAAAHRRAASIAIRNSAANQLACTSTGDAREVREILRAVDVRRMVEAVMAELVGQREALVLHGVDAVDEDHASGGATQVRAGDALGEIEDGDRRLQGLHGQEHVAERVVERQTRSGGRRERRRCPRARRGFGTSTGRPRWRG